MTTADVLIIGAGAAGLFCAGVCQQLGLKVVLLDHYPKVAEKIRISGGGRSNFTNLLMDASQPHRHFLGENPAFARSALVRYTAQDFVSLMNQHGVPYHEKHKGQLFCDHSSQDLIDMLLKECQAGAKGGELLHWQPCALHALTHHDSVDGAPHYLAQTDRGPVQTRAVVVATGGLSIPAIGATDLGFRLATQFGMSVVTPRPALVPLTFEAHYWKKFSGLSGLSLPVSIKTTQGKLSTVFEEDLLLTHKGLSGPAALQISSFWAPEQSLTLDWLPGQDLGLDLVALKQHSKKLLSNELAAWLPNRLVQAWLDGQPQWHKAINDTPDKSLAALAQSLKTCSLKPNGTEGYKKAEVTAGGVSVSELSQQTLESKKQPGLYFIGEVVDITGWLGGYNFQWAWSSAHACAKGLASQLNKL
jgi:hypothetical protein